MNKGQTMTETASKTVHLQTPLTEDMVRTLRVGDRVLLSGVVYTARDAAHKRLLETVQAGQTLPLPLQDQIIYYVGPSPARPGDVIGSAGPTTAGRVDVYTPPLLALGLKGMIGKGKRNDAVRQAIVKHAAVYFVTVGGAAALIAQRIRRVEIVAFEDLGTEAIRKLEVEEFPLVVANDVHGADLFELGHSAYRRKEAIS